MVKSHNRTFKEWLADSLAHHNITLEKTNSTIITEILQYTHTIQHTFIEIFVNISEAHYVQVHNVHRNFMINLWSCTCSTFWNAHR